VNVHPILKIISWSIIHSMNFVVKNTEIPIRAVWYSLHIKVQADPICASVSSQHSLGREIAPCPPLEKRAVHSLLVA